MFADISQESLTAPSVQAAMQLSDAGQKALMIALNKYNSGMPISSEETLLIYRAIQMSKIGG